MIAISELSTADLAERIHAARLDWEHAVAEDRAKSTSDTRKRKRDCWESLCELVDEDNRRMWANDFPF